MTSGGAERVMANIASRLAERGDIDVDFLFVTAQGPYLEQLHPDVNVIDLDCGRIAFSLPGLVRYLRSSRPDALLSALDPPNLLATVSSRLAFAGNRMVVTEHCDFSSALDAAENRGAAAVVPTLVKWIYPRADAVVAVSHGVADDLAESTGLPRQKVSVVGNPVITAELKAKAAQAPTHPWFGDGGPPVVMAVGRLAHQKNFELLLTSMATVMANRSVRLVIFGEGPDRDKLEAQAGELGIADRVDFPGFVDNPYAHMAAADLFVLSSHFEGLPTVLIEALYCGVPIVSTDCPSGPDEILDGGRHGTLVTPGDPDELAAAIEAALAAESKPAVSEESWRPFEEDTVVEEYLDVLLDR
jgi:glycosyltransferase involved in cell wall biosynthesis